VDYSALMTMDAFDAGARFGFRSPSDVTTGRPTWVDDGGFLTGAAGIALALHRYAGGAEPRTAWDAALLVT
jgi:class I lanthipeptide synthase